MKPRLSRSSFFGRAPELRQLHRLFTEQAAPLVTVTGPPGAGKTRLVCRFGDDWVGSGKRCWFCDLSAARTLEDIVGSVAAACGIKLLGVKSLQLEIDRIGQLLAECGELLVILDNFEQVAEHAASSVGLWQELAPNVRWLLTSRTQLHLQQEIDIALAGLLADDATALFIERARLAWPDFALAADHVAALAELIVRLDALPLCIELAAARANVLSLPQMLALLGRRFELLRVPEGQTEPRHTTLQATIEWSWQLLPRWEQHLLAQCAVFRGSFSLAAAYAVVAALDAEAQSRDVAPGSSVLDGLQSLHERSLLRVLPAEAAPGQLCYGLYESIRDFAAARLQELAVADAVARRHADYYLTLGDALGRDLIGSPPQECLTRAARNLGNYYDIGARFGPTDPTRAVRALLILGAVLCRQASFETLRGLLDEAVVLAQRDVAPGGLAAALCARGRMLGLRGFWRLAAADFDRALAYIKSSGAEASDEGRITYLLNTAYCNLGEPARARPYAERTVELAQNSAECELLALSHYALGKLHLVQDELAQAGQAFLESATLFCTLPGHRGQALALGNLSITLVRQGRFDEARPHLLQALQLFRVLEDQVLEDKLLCELAQVFIGQELYEEAEQIFTRVAASALKHGDRELAARVSIGRAMAALHAGNTALTRQHLAVALSAAQLTQCPPLETRIARLQEAAQEPSGSPPPLSLHATPGGYGFQLDGGDPVDLSRRPALRRIMATLLQARLATPDEPLSVERLFAAGWPGDRARFESCTQRVYTAVYSLRRFGLGVVLLSRDGGYLLDSTVAVKQQS